ncbi:MAG: IS110 family transposase [Actinobacteria bacterium]|nr:IS110 family transposase [Actinomycetota bacterium]
MLGRGLWPREVRWDRRCQQSYGAGLARHLKAQGVEVLEVERPKRRQRSSRRNVKSDPLDAESAARAVLAGETSGVPKSGDGCVEMIRALRTARRSAMIRPGRRLLKRAPGLAGDSTGRTPQPFARTLLKGTRRRGCTLPSRR